jgi:1-acyl-sn-glycerol-3-phosphate acyltransferase
MKALLVICLGWLVRRLYRIRIEGRERLDACADGAVVIVNHVSFFDGILICAAMRPRPFCAVDLDVGQVSWVRPVIAMVDHVLLDSAHPFALRRLIKAAREGHQVAIFPEARITVTGNIMKCYAGAHFVAARSGKPVIVAHLDGPERSTFSYLGSILRQKRFPKVTVSYSSPVEVPAMADRVEQSLFLYDQLSIAGYRQTGGPLLDRLEDISVSVGRDKPVLRDNYRKPMTLGQVIDALKDGVSEGTADKDGWSLSSALGYLGSVNCDATDLQIAAALGTGWDINPGDRVFVATGGEEPLGRIGGILLPLLRGASVMVWQDRRNTRTLGELLYDFNATVLVITGTAVAELQKMHPYDMRSVRMILTTEDTPGLDSAYPRVLHVRGTGDGRTITAFQSPFWAHRPDGYRNVVEISAVMSEPGSAA